MEHISSFTMGPKYVTPWKWNRFASGRHVNHSMPQASENKLYNIKQLKSTHQSYLSLIWF